ncbi:MAG: type II toxin-antitoxin system HicB family antitoxin [Turicibacter sp.]|nr:type II toxin-antitoxin system HicB family antitoxin [Turicibacter sp.]
MAKYTYPAIFRPENSGYFIFFPDINDGATSGETLSECIEMATDWLSGALYMRERNSVQIPNATEISDLEHKEGDIITLILGDTEMYGVMYEDKNALLQTFSLQATTAV